MDELRVSRAVLGKIVLGICVDVAVGIFGGYTLDFGIIVEFRLTFYLIRMFFDFLGKFPYLPCIPFDSSLGLSSSTGFTFLTLFRLFMKTGSISNCYKSS